MSYWNRLEPIKGKYNFRELDWQLALADKYGAEVTLCLGLRQPRWPENHWPQWARTLPEEAWQKALAEFITAVIERYKDRPCIVSYQLENEALLRTFGEHGNFDRQRLRRELKLVKQLDPSRPVIMTASDSWGLPLLGPLPDMFGFSVYRYFYDRGRYRRSRRPPGLYRTRARLIQILTHRPVFIHELQAEPWGPKAIPDMPLAEQFKSINLDRVHEMVRFAVQTGLHPIDLWGLEWWYWLKVRHQQPKLWDELRKLYTDEAG